MQHRETGIQVYKSILGNVSTIASLIRGPYVTSARAYALNLGFAAVYIFGFTLDSLVEEAQNVRSATIKAVHAAYYSEESNYYITDDGWYRIFAKHYDEAMKNPSDPTSAFQAAYSGMQRDIEQYVTGYWNHGKHDIFTVLESGRRFNYDATPKEREYLNAVARRDLYKRLNASVLKRGAQTHTVDVGLWHAPGLGAVPKYGARYTYKWTPFSEARGRQPEIKGQ